MKKNTTLLFIILSIFITYFCALKDDIILNIVFIISINLLQILKNIKNINFKIVTIVQLLGICLWFISLDNKSLMLLLPITLFELINEYVWLYSNIFLSYLISIFIFKENLVYVLIYILIVNLYLYEIKRNEESIYKLKSIYKQVRDEKFLIERKVDNFNKYLEQNEVVVSLRERNFMAQKVHDHLGHKIASSIMQLEVTKETLGKDNELSKKYLVSAIENLRTGMEEIRQVLRNIKPEERSTTLEDIKDRLLKFQYDTGIKVNFKTQGNTTKLNIRVLTVIEENLNEALTNILKYSKASKVDISIYIYNKIIRVEVKDNGIGCSKLNKGLGIKGMEERMGRINGRIEIDNDYGFRINMIFSLED